MSVARPWSLVRVSLGLAMCMLLALAPLAQAQVTTGNLAGTVTASDGSALPGVTVDAVHVPTGTRYSDVTNDSGRFNMPNVRVGGPYRVTANLEGFRAFDRSNITVNLGSTAEVPVTLALAAMAEAITVTATTDEIINPNRTGSSSAVSTEQIEALPTVNRSLQDFARTNPYFRVDPSDITATRMNVAGKNNRYNQIQIDGAVNNDLFGLSDTGTPGGQTDAQPISVDAIEQLQLVVSPYDVRQGGFTGGGVNAVTRSGTNALKGTAFYSTRRPDLIGEGPRGIKVSDFDSNQTGASVGGRIIRDRLFFFVNGEMSRREAPTGGAADGTAATNFNRSGFDPAAFRQSLISRYNYDPGDLGDYPIQTDSDNFFGRFDVNVNNQNQLTLRHNYVKGGRDNAGSRSSSRFTFPTSAYTIADETNSTVAQLNSVISGNAFNEFRFGYQTIKDVRTLPVIFPSIEVGGAAQNSALTAGSERFSGANGLDQTITELTDDFTLTRGNHTLIFGTHNEFFDFKNLFLSDTYGAYFFPTQAAWDENKPTEYRISYATGDDPRAPTKFGAAQYGLYASDQWRMNNSLTLTFGIRGDIPKFDDTPAFNPTVQNLIGYNTASTPKETWIVSPRLGFNWNPGGNGNQQLRGGIGVFAGRTPYVWVSNAYGGTGVAAISLTCLASAGCTVPQYNPDPAAQPRNLGSGGTLTVDLIDDKFEFPRVLRTTLGYDRDLLFGVRGTVEAVYSQTQKDVFYYNTNLKLTGTSPLDGRPTYSRVSTGMGDAFLLSNTSQGEELIGTLQLSRRFTNGLYVGASYAHQDTKSAFDATSSRAVSNWRFRHTSGDIFKDDVSRSAFETEHRINTNLAYSFRTGPLAHTIGAYFNMESGRPYSIMMGGDPNKDFQTVNDLLYVPGGADKVILCPSTAGSPVAGRPCGGTATAPIAPNDYSRLANFLSSVGVDPNEARIVDRYEFTEPWSRQMDVHYELGLPVRGIQTGLTFDVFNFLNLFDNNYGKVEFVSNQNITVLNYQGQDSVSGKPIYREAFSTALDPGSQFSLADTRSRWTARVGVRVSF